MTAEGLGSAVLPNQATSWEPFQATNGPDPLERWLDLIEAPIGVDRKPAPAPSPKGTPPTPVSSSWASRLGRLVVGEESAERLELLVKWSCPGSVGTQRLVAMTPTRTER